MFDDGYGHNTIYLPINRKIRRTPQPQAVPQFDVGQQLTEALSKSKEFEAKCERLQSELSSFTKYESVKKVKQIEELLEILNENVESVSQETKTWWDELNQQECSTFIEQQMAEYRKLKLELSQAGIAFMTEPNFSSMIEDFHKICKINDTRVKAILKPLCDATTRVKRKTEKFTLSVETSLKSVEHFKEEETNKLKELNRESIRQSMNVEQELYADILETIAERMYVFNSIKATVDSRDEKLKTRTTRKDYRHLIENDLVDSTENSIIMYKISKSDDREDDLTTVKSFLNQTNLGTDLEIKVKQLDRPGKPLRVTFPDTQVIEQLLQLPNEKTYFRGSYIRMKRCDE